MKDNKDFARSRLCYNKKKLVNKKMLVNTKNIISIHTSKLEILSAMS